VSPAFSPPNAKQQATDYALQHFGGATGEVQVYDDARSAVERKLMIDRRAIPALNVTVHTNCLINTTING
jgi:hypothetical protein